MSKPSFTYVAFLRGINVGGHHKVPMKTLVEIMKSLEFSNISTLLNSGNVIFESEEKDNLVLEDIIEKRLFQEFNFPIPTIVRKSDELLDVLNSSPFEGFELNNDLRFYITFLKSEPKQKIDLPWQSEDKSFKIIKLQHRTVVSILDLSKCNTPKGMDALEKMYGKDITTRNWNTLVKIGACCL